MKGVGVRSSTPQTALSALRDAPPGAAAVAFLWAARYIPLPLTPLANRKLVGQRCFGVCVTHPLRWLVSVRCRYLSKPAWRAVRAASSSRHRWRPESAVWSGSRLSAGPPVLFGAERALRQRPDPPCTEGRERKNAFRTGAVRFRREDPVWNRAWCARMACANGGMGGSGSGSLQRARGLGVWLVWKTRRCHGGDIWVVKLHLTCSVFQEMSGRCDGGSPRPHKLPCRLHVWGARLDYRCPLTH
eukprot:4321095-Pyramimonas_sp.AAC.1